MIYSLVLLNKPVINSDKNEKMGRVKSDKPLQLPLLSMMPRRSSRLYMTSVSASPNTQCARMLWCRFARSTIGSATQCSSKPSLAKTRTTASRGSDASSSTAEPKSSRIESLEPSS